MTPHRIKKVAVIGWDLGHNPAGRAWLLADVLRGAYEIEFVGPLFERYNTEVWQPIRDTEVSIRSTPGRMFPEFRADAESFAATIDADLVYACKSRLPSMLIGALVKERLGIPMVVDVDDHELAFFGGTEPITLDRALADDHDDLLIPFEKSWTRVATGLATEFDAVTVSNPALQREFGGQIVPHVRDERVFDPARFDRDAVRRDLGFGPDDRVVFFGGTPRRHKGIVELAEATAALADRNVRLMLIGTNELREMSDELEPLGDALTVLPYQPLDRMPELLAASDVVCVLQDPESHISRFQIPAKLTDAMAMGVPILVSSTEPVLPLFDLPGISTVSRETLHDDLTGAIDSLGDRSEVSAAMRDAFLAEFSYRAHRPRMVELFESLAESPAPISPPVRQLLDTTEELYGAGPGTDSATPAVVRHRRTRVDDGYDIVLFWKQNDTGIYGRRHDMLVRYLARSPRVHRIIQFDRPIDPVALTRPLLGRHDADQSWWVAKNTMRRMLGRDHDDKIWRHTFLNRPGGRISKAPPFRSLPPADDFAAYVLSTLARRGVGRDHPLVLWTYPTSFEFPAIRDAIDADLVVADVVDDNRSWLDPTEPYYQRVTENYRDILGRSDVILANCAESAERMTDFVDDIHVVPNAAEPPDRYDRAHTVPAEIASIPSPRLGYVGNLSDRIDIELLDQMAVARPDWHLVLIGSAHRDRAILRLDQHPNVHFLGVRPYEEAKQMMRHFDVGLIPHVDNDMTRAMHPLKAFVYSSQGVPVVATGIANLTELGSLIKVGGSRDEFIRLIESTLAERGSRPAVDPDLHTTLEPHTWPVRVDAILDLMDETMARR